MTEKEKADIIKYLLTSDEITREFPSPGGHYTDHKTCVECYFPEQKNSCRFSVTWHPYQNSVAVSVCTRGFLSTPYLQLASRFTSTGKMAVATAAKFFLNVWNGCLGVCSYDEDGFKDYFDSAKAAHEHQLRADELAAAAAEDPDLQSDHDKEPQE